MEISMAGSRGEASDAIRLLQRRLTILTCDTAHAMPTTLLLLQQTPTSARAPSPSLPNCQQALYSAAQRHQLTHHPSRELTARLLSALASLACMLRQGACVRVSTFVFLATSAAFFLFPLAFLWVAPPCARGGSCPAWCHLPTSPSQDPLLSSPQPIRRTEQRCSFVLPLSVSCSCLPDPLPCSSASSNALAAGWTLAADPLQLSSAA